MAKVAAKSLGCTIKTLSPELSLEAARVAVEVYPANRPAVAQFASTLEGTQSDVATPQFIAALTTKYWGPKPRVIPVQFLDNPDAATIRMILSHANAWDCGITFAHTTGQGVVRISRGPGGYWSYLGTDVTMVSGVTMNLQGFTSRSDPRECRRVITHEFGHTLGFPHEHLRRDLVARLDRGRTIAYFARTQGWSRRDVEMNVLTPLDESSIMGTPVDQDSIMCYQLPGEITVDGRPIPGGFDLTASDLSFVDTIYPLAAGPVEPPSPPPKPEPPTPPKPEPPTEPEPEPKGKVKAIRLYVGKESRKVKIRPGETKWFVFEVTGMQSYAASTRGSLPLVMSLYGPDDRGTLIVKDENASGLGPNAAVASTLTSGTHWLAVKGMSGIEDGPFTVKVAAL